MTNHAKTACGDASATLETTSGNAGGTVRGASAGGIPSIADRGVVTNGIGKVCGVGDFMCLKDFVHGLQGHLREAFVDLGHPPARAIFVYVPEEQRSQAEFGVEVFLYFNHEGNKLISVGVLQLVELDLKSMGYVTGRLAMQVSDSDDDSVLVYFTVGTGVPDNVLVC